MATTILKHAAEDDQTGWKTEEYHGKWMHVCAEPRVPENEALSGHGLQWMFKVKITDSDTGPTDDEVASSRSDPGLFYSTQAIAQDMGFLKGRELIEGGWPIPPVAL